MCGAFKKKRYIFFCKSKTILYEHDTAIENGQVHQWSFKIKIYMIYL